MKNGGAGLVRCLLSIRAKEVDDEIDVVVIDSGSTDGSRTRARGLGARVVEIPSHDFNHCRVRNLGAEWSHGDVLVFATQDAYAADFKWLASLVARLRDGTRVAGVYGRQIPHDDATSPERYFLDFMYGPRPRIQKVAALNELSYEHTLFSRMSTRQYHERSGRNTPSPTTSS